ncbi:MAG: ASKHA domain-containing protein [Anaerolineae bacterium]
MTEVVERQKQKAIVVFKPSGQVVEVEIGTLLSDAAVEAGIPLNLPCGGQGRCGRCRVKVEHGDVSHRSAARITSAERSEGWALGCQAVIKGDAVILVPEQEQVEIEFVTKTVGAERIALAAKFKHEVDPSVHRAHVTITPPSLDDQTTDWDRLLRALSLEHGIQNVTANLPVLRNLARDLREADWSVTAVLDMDDPEKDPCARPRLIDLLPGNQTDRCYGVAIDIGTTSNVIYLVDLVQGKVIDRASAYSGQIQAGEDVISRIIFAQKRDGLNRLQKMVLKTLNGLLEELTSRNQIPATQISKAVVAGNTTMIQLFLALDPRTIREMPFIPTISKPLPITAEELGLAINPHATVDCLPVVGAYVGADTTAGVLASGMYDTDALTLFIDVGTNGEIVLGNRDWLITCACSAGPAFEGSGVRHGMRATAGAIEEVWIDPQTYEPTYETIGDMPARGICGSGMIGLLADMFITGAVDKAGKITRDLPTPRVRVGDHGGEYVVVWANQSAIGTDIVINEVDIENLLRTKGAIYAGFSVLVQSVGVELADVEQVFIAGAFGQYINIEKAIQIGLLPDMPWERFQYLGNTSALGAFHSLVSRAMRREVFDIAQKMTYLELSADNTFYDQFMSALFLPHTDITAFPSVMRLLEDRED